MRIVVTGGSGDLGSRVVQHLTERGHEAVAASRRTGVDLGTGSGLDAVLRGASAVVLCAMNAMRAAPVELGGTARVLAALDEADEPPPHVVYVSIVGCDAGDFAYYDVKSRAEAMLQGWGGPATVMRATQFHSLAALMAGLRIGRLGVRVGDMRVQPVDVGFVAEQLAAIATGQVPRGFARATDVAGPDRFDIQELADLIASHDGRRSPTLLRLPPVGGSLRTFSDGAILPEQDVAIGGEPFASWLGRQPRPLPRHLHDPLR